MTIGLEHPDGETLVGTTRISHGGLGVSSNNKRTWVHEGKRYHHIIDPTGEQPTVQGSYVKADTALVADTLATIVFLRPDLVPTLEHDYNAQVLLHPVS
jgi:thiamine biosynthesis lipoprotein